MIRGGLAALLLAVATAGATARAQERTVAVVGPATNPLREATPRFTITASGFAPSELPLQLRLQLALSSDFGAPLFADTTVAGQSATVVIPRLLPPRVSVWWRAIAITAQGALVNSVEFGPRRSAQWLTLIEPNNLNGSTVGSLRPTFLWTSAAILPPVAPWQYSIVITQANGVLAAAASGLTDTTFVPFADLESNTPYRWAVTAVAGTGDSVRVVNLSSFVITSANAPIATVLFQNFPNPFPTDRLNATCIWFDLRRQSDVTVEVLDLRGNRVAKILPGRGLGLLPGGTLPPGRYGRAAFGSDSGCDERLTWDGTDSRGRVVPRGVYLIKFTGDGVTETKRVLFRGR